MTKLLFELDRSLPQVMAVLNVTPDSFSDGGSYYQYGKLSLDLCRQRIEAVIAQGASIIDVGGESTRPGAMPVTVQEEMDRVFPVLEVLQDYDVVVSLDSSSPEVIVQADKIGIGLLNDVRALSRQNALEAAAATQLPICLMHMLGEPSTMQRQPSYKHVVDDVKAFFKQRISACIDAGIERQRLILDPGFGFGKSLTHNMQLLANLDAFEDLCLPLMVGLSRKSMIVHLLGERNVEQRLPASLALAAMAVNKGAWVVRAHDVQETADALTIVASIRSESDE